MDLLKARYEAANLAPGTAAQVRACVAEAIELAAEIVLDIMRSRVREKEVLDLPDEPAAG